MEENKGLLFRIKQTDLIRVAAYPFVNGIRLFRKWFYRYGKEAKKIRKLRGIHQGQRCFIIGNGPSLTPDDLTLLKDEFCFGANRVFEMFDQTPWRPTYYFCADSFVLSDQKEKIKTLDLDYIFLHLEGKKEGLHRVNPNITYINNYYPFMVKRYHRMKHLHVSQDVSAYFYGGETVTFTAIQMALYMGFQEIYLVGVDHFYSRRMDSKGNFIYDPKVKDYFGSLQSKNYNIQNFEIVDDAYQAAKEYCESHGVKIRNATRGGALEIFQREDLDEVLGKKS